MKKIKYFYNTNSLRYEKLETPLRVKLLRVFGFLAAAVVTAAIISFFAFRFIGSPNEKLLNLENERLQDKYHQLNDQVKAAQEQMSELVKGTTKFTELFLKPTQSPIVPGQERWRRNRRSQGLKICGRVTW